MTKEKLIKKDKKFCYTLIKNSEKLKLNLRISIKKQKQCIESS